ncbi:MAG: hypothetical protein GY909_16615 [Oligoflexia bacterium]|nr:hypothetical protein [Oligoflexia bacterium]
MKLFSYLNSSFFKQLTNVGKLMAMSIVLTACIGGEGGKKKANCGEGQTFDTVSRSCKGAVVQDETPNTTLSATSIAEDSGANTITLSYSDSQNDKAIDCSVRSLSGDGIVKQLELQGILFNSRSTITSPQNIWIQFVNTGAIGVSTAVIGINTYITVTINEGTTRSFDIVTAVEGDGDNDCGDGDASCYVQALFEVNQFNTSFSSPVNLDQIRCECVGGVCTTDITPVDNYFGTSEFEYQLTDNDGVTDYQLVQLNITSVNDQPTTTSTAVTLPVTEDVLAAGTLTTDTGFTVADTNDGDPLGALLTWTTVSNPTNGTLVLSSIGTYTYQTAADYTGADSFIVKACDPGGLCTPNITVNVAITAVADNPTATLTTISAFDEDVPAANPSDQVTLTYTDPEGDVATACTISATSKVYVSTDCTCVAGVCTVGITGRGHENGVGSFSYSVTAGTTSLVQNVLFFLNSISDNPYTFGTSSAGTIDADGNILFNESATHTASTVSFTLNSSTDPDSNSITSYAIVDSPVNGTLANCMGLDGSSATDLSCDYTPNDGNLNNGSTFTATDKASATVANLTFRSKVYGSGANGVTVNLIDAENVGGGSEYAWVDGTQVNILFEAGVSTENNIVTAVNASPNAEVQDLIVASTTSGATVYSTVTTLTLTGGASAADTFSYRATDSTGAQATKKYVPIVIQPVNDQPTICEYTKFVDYPECGVSGCIDNGSPTANLTTPTVNDIYYYDLQTGSCWKSNTAVSGGWELTDSYVADHTFNELETLTIDNIVVDEGGGDASEDAETISITAVSSDNTVLIPANNVRFFRGITEVSGGGLPYNFADTGSADTNDLRIEITPTTSQTGTANISFTLSDGTNTRTVSFAVTVSPNSATHNGWTQIVAYGPTVNKYNQILNSNYTCSYSRSFCSGGDCKGTATPLNTVTPSDIDAIYYDSQNNNCYRIDESAVKVTVQNIDYYPRKSTGASVEYVTGGVAGAEVVTVSGTKITVQIQSGVSTEAQIITAIRANYQANDLVEVVDNTGGTTAQVTVTETAIAGFDASHWTSLQTYCAISFSDDETSCSVLGSTCAGAGDPTTAGVGAPSTSSSYYLDKTNNTCYQALDSDNDGAADSWATYSAPGYVKLSWNSFSLSGSGSITGYNVYRRSTQESFDYDRPINIETVTTTANSFEDIAGKSYYPPSPNKVYYYEVRPIINSIPTATNQDEKIVRLFVPPNNMSFVHRWMVNQDICGLMNISTEDASDFKKCKYDGLGDTGNAPDSNFYDIGADLVVDRFESGCPYTDNSETTCGGGAASCACSTTDGTCIGLDDPTTAGITANDDAIYYSRSSGMCYVRTGGAWVDIETNGAFTARFAPNTPRLPPMVNVTGTSAAALCNQYDTNGFYGANTQFHGITTNPDAELPFRKQQIAFGQWDRVDYTDGEMTTLETGLSLNSSSKCNSSAASGLESGYTNIDIPDSNNFYSLPASASAGFKTMVTGSSETSACQSRYGIQDSIGNVGEWGKEQIDCTNMSVCAAITAVSSDMQAGDGSDPYIGWTLNPDVGPCVDADSNGTCDSSIPSWTLEDENYNAGRFFIPVGLPVDVDFPLNNPTSIVADYMSEIGPTSGITSSQLHDDTISINSIEIYNNTVSRDGQLVYGGRHNVGTAAGVWNAEFVPENDPGSTANYAIIGQMTLNRPAGPFTITLVDPGGAGALGIGVAGTDVTVTLAHNGTTVTSTFTDVVTALNADGGFTGIGMTARVTGTGGATAGSVSQTNSTPISKDPIEPDIGFRCMWTIDDTDYQN